jgi:hypothetical protein
MDPGFSANGDVDLSDFVLFVHRDLLTKERLDTIWDSRRIEDTPKNRFQFVVFLLGLFHYKMACVDALWRTYLRDKDGRSDLNSTYQHVGILRPQETGIMTSKPGFQWMHDMVHHELHCYGRLAIVSDEDDDGVCPECRQCKERSAVL